MSALIIGYGQRAKNNIIPALKALNKNIYIYGRSQKKVSELCIQTNCTQIKSLSLLPKNLDIICIAVPSDYALDFINQIDNEVSLKSILYLDTPFFGKFNNIELLKLHKRFKKTLVTEDWISKPSFEIVERLAIDHNLGNLKEIIFNNSGYFYHSLAIARKLFKQKINFAYKKNGNYFFYFGFKKMRIINPKDYDNCSTIFRYKYGSIDLKYGDNASVNKKYFSVSSLLSGQKISYFYTYGDKKNINIISYKNPLSKVDAHYESVEKVISLQKKFTLNETEYLLEDGAYDSLIFTIMNRINFFIDISLGEFSVIYKFLKLYGKI